jgi:NhaP-type Na+/H+ or K+/H+ antiporter
MAWMMAEALQLSGIVSILFCGIVMAHYTTHNLHPRTEIFSRRFFKTLAFGSESFVFIYMGLATFTYHLSSQPRIGQADASIHYTIQLTDGIVCAWILPHCNAQFSVKW